MSLFKTNANENYIKPTRANNVYGGLKNQRRQSEDKMIKATEERIIRDIKNLFELEDYYKPATVGNYETLAIKEYLD